MNKNILGKPVDNQVWYQMRNQVWDKVNTYE